jgi:type IV secretion system protein VirD4
MTPWSSDTPSVPKLLAAGLLGTVVGLWVTGYVFLWAIREPPNAATPLTALRYWAYHGGQPAVRGKLAWSAAAGFGLVAVGIGLLVIPRPRPLHGDARFASVAEVHRAGLFADSGLVLGRMGGRFITLGGQQGVMLAAPPRSDKGVAQVIPNLLNWPGSVVCTDIKRENWTKTAGYRAWHGQACFLFDPLSEDGRTARWNPFGYVSARAERRVNDLQRIADMLYPDPPNVDPFWTASARSLFLGIALYLFETPSLPRTLGEVLRQGMASDDEGFGAHWKRLVEGRQSGNRPLSAACVRALYDVIDLAPVTASSIRKTFTSRLDLWLNPILDAATADNDFDLRDLRKTPMSVYVAANPDDLHRIRPVLNLFFQQAIGLQTRALPEHDVTLRHQVLMMLDEFPALGKIPIIGEAIAYLPGYNVRLFMVIQAPSQLREVYWANTAETMMKTLAARIVYAPKDFADAKEISDELGTTTVKAKSVSRPLFGGGKTPTVNVSEQRRSLLLPQEVKELGRREEIIFYEGLRPIRCRKNRYYEERRFLKRLLPPPEVPALCIGLPVAEGPATTAANRSARKPDQAMAGGSEQGNTLAQDPESIRPFEAADLAQLDTLGLDDFAVSFDSLDIPAGRRLSEAELTRAVETFLDGLTD